MGGVRCFSVSFVPIVFFSLALWHRCAVAGKSPCSVYKNSLGLESASSRTQRRAAAGRNASVYAYLPESIYIADLMLVETNWRQRNPVQIHRNVSKCTQLPRYLSVYCYLPPTIYLSIKVDPHWHHGTKDLAWIHHFEYFLLWPSQIY